MAKRIRSTIKSLEFIMANTTNIFEAQLLQLEIDSLNKVVAELEEVA